jgi:hypothetical protein
VSAARGHRCPKCGRARADGASACARCGLVYARWSQPPQASPQAALDAEGEALWAGLQAAWDDNESGHDAFVKHCAKGNRLPAAGRAYREFLDGQPGDAVATRMQARIVGMATAVLLPLRATPVVKTRGNWFPWVVAIGAVVGVLAGLFFQVLSD